MIDDMTNRRENEQQEEAKGKESDPQELSRRRASLIAEFQTYLHITFEELCLASHAETEALRTPLLTMNLTEEEISAWERFQPLIPKQLHSAHALHAKIAFLLQEASAHGLLHPQEIAVWQAFFQSKGIGFQEKEHGVQELTKELTSRAVQNEESTTKERQEPRQERREQRKHIKKTENTPTPPKDPPPEEDPQEQAPTSPPLPSPDVTPRTTTQQHIRWLLALLPSSIAPLYLAATHRGSTTLQAVQKTLEQSLLRQGISLRHRKGMVVLTQEHLKSTENSLQTCKTCALQGEEAPTVILEPLSRTAQSAMVHGIHQPLLQDLHTLEQNGMHL